MPARSSAPPPLPAAAPQNAECKSGQRIDHGQVAQNMRMVSFSRSCRRRRLIKFLVNGVDVEEHDERDQAKHGFRQLDVKKCFAPS